MQYDRTICIAVGGSRKSLTWQNSRLSVSELYKRFEHPVRSSETMQEYLHLKKLQQDELKDCAGGFIGGELSSPRRKAGNVTGRDLITLDFDNIPGWQTDAVIAKMDALHCGYCVYSTRKHVPERPRLRIIVPTDRTMTPDEYEPCARRVAAHVGIGMADPSTFELSRLFYFPTCCADSEFVYKAVDKPLASVDVLLKSYADWRDVTSWPVIPGAVSYQKLAVKQGTPEEKSGIVGAFCRTYDVLSAIDAFLHGIYEPVDGSTDRYTYLGGSTAGGAVIYDGGRFLYSHHATDPCSGRLVNAFDLVRLHKFGDKDNNALPDTPITKLPSYTAMRDLALSDKQVCATLSREQHERVVREFECVGSASTSEGATTWTENLQRTQDGKIKNTIDNVLIILDGDSLLRGKFALNQFAGRGEVLGSLPWREDGKRRLWSDTDTNGLYWYMERFWGISGRGNIDSALDIHASQHAFNEVRDYIDSLTWDGIPRLDTLFIDYLGAEDTAYNRAVCRKSFTAAVTRVMTPGCKYDNMVILAGPQGIGKSTLLDKMSRGWFNDSIRTFEGKDASELLQGVWLVEVSELDAFRKTDVARIKQFLSLRADRYRAAYGRHVSELPRQCVFFGSTNTTDFLQDTTGNRRFWPVDVGEQPHAKTVWHDLTDDVVDQLWAEAKVRWQTGEPLYISGDVEQEALERQEAHREASVHEGIIAEFAAKQVPVDWCRWTIDRRRDYWCGAARMPDGREIELVDRDRISAAEVWCEMLNGNIRDITNADTRKINAVLARLPGWTRSGPLRFGPYSVQRGFIRSNIQLQPQQQKV